MEQGVRVQSAASPSASEPRARGPHHPAPSSTRILVSGYPSYTQPQDLLEVFTKFGNVRIDKCNNWSATLTFVSAEEARAALGGNKRLHIYGHYLVVKPYSAKTAADDARPNQPTTPKREFPMTKQKGIILDPKKLDLSGDFHTQLDNILSAVRLTQEDVKCLSQLYTDLEAVLQVLWPGCKAVPFGSITTGLGIKTSDADCFINIPGQYRQPHGNFVNKAKRVLQQYNKTFAEILAIPRANTPIVKLFHIPTNTNCDVTFKTPLGAQNSRLVAFLLHADPRLLPVAVFIKYWAKVHELTGTGKLTNYALTLMIIFYLQQPPLRALPGVRSLQARAAAVLVDHWDTGFVPDPALLPRAPPARAIADLIGGFFEYYSLFNFDEMMICPYLGAPVRRDLFQNTATVPDEFERYKNNVLNHYVMPIRYQNSICVQDPFEQCHNVASTVTSKLALDLKTYFKFCANAFEKEKLNGCQEFLKTILLQKPKLIRGKTHPEYRINLFPRIVNTIIGNEWKSVIRDVVMEIFEKMLKIKLGKVEEKVNPDSRKEKEKYSGVLTKPIWKRKAFSKLYSIVDLSFAEKQGKITQEIMNVEKQDLSVQFQLTLTYCHDPKSAVISIRLGGGDLEAFREFGKFFISIAQNWLTELLKPFSMPNCKDTATKIAETMEAENNEDVVDSDDDEDSENIIEPDSDQTVDRQTINNTDETSTIVQEALRDKTETISTTQRTLTINSVDSLAHKTDDILKINENNLTQTAENLTNNIDDTIVEQDVVLTDNKEKALTKNTETMTKNVEDFFKKAETLLASSTANIDQPTASASDVTVACALK